MSNAKSARRGARSIRTMDDLLQALSALGYTETTAAQIRPQIKRCQTVYRTPLHRIPADLDDFERRWGRGRDAKGAIAAGLRDQAQFLEWRRRVRAALAKAHKPRAAEPTARLAAWDELLAYVAAHTMGNDGHLPPHLDLSIGALARHASARGIEPVGMTDDAAVRIFDGAQGKLRRTLRCGLRSFARLCECGRTRADVGHLLPSGAPALPPPAKRRTAAYGRDALRLRRLWSQFDARMALRRETLGEDEDDDEREGRGRDRYEDAVRGAIAALDAKGYLPAEPELNDVLSIPGLAAYHTAWKARVECGELREDATSFSRDMQRLIYFAHVGADEKEREALTKLRKNFKRKAPSTWQMSPAHLSWIKRYGRDPAQQRALHRMPWALMGEATRILARWDAGKPLRRRERMRALDLGTAAAMSAVLFLVAPIRRGNLRSLRIHGPEAELNLLGAAPHLSIDGTAVKNRRPIEIEGDDEAMPILRWFVDDVRARLITDHPYGKPAQDSDFLFAGPQSHAPLDDTTLAARFDAGVAAVGLDLTIHLARHVCAFHILARDPNAWEEAAQVLGDRANTVRKYYGWLNERRVGETGRSHLRAARREVHRHRRGQHFEEGRSHG